MSSITDQITPALPEPAGFRTRYRSEPGMIGHYPWTYADHQRRRYDRPECEYENLFTEEQVRNLIAAALADAQHDGTAGLSRKQSDMLKQEVNTVACLTVKRERNAQAIRVKRIINDLIADAPEAAR